MKGTKAYNSSSINRKLENADTTQFSHSFPDWRGNGRMVVSGVNVPFAQVFSGFENVDAIKDTFRDRTKSVLSKLVVGVYDGEGFAWIDTERGRLRFMISRKYLLKGRKVDIYLDVVHELTHIKQHMKGMELWDEKYRYVDRPTEIEAYGAAVAEAKRLGFTLSEIKRYLRVPFIPKENFGRLFRNLDLE